MWNQGVKPELKLGPSVIRRFEQLLEEGVWLLRTYICIV